MRKSYSRRFGLAAAAVAAFGLLFWSGCSQDLMAPDTQAPRGSSITNPVDHSSLNESVISVRGRAEVGKAGVARSEAPTEQQRTYPLTSHRPLTTMPEPCRSPLTSW